MADPKSSDDGFTLVELVVASLLLIVVLGMLAGFYFASVSTQQLIERGNDSNSYAQTASNTIANGIRNSTKFELTENVGGAGSQLLTAQVARGGDSLEWKCAAWYYDAARDELRYREKTAPMPTAPYTSWALLASDVQPVSGTGIFASASSGKGISIKFKLLSGDDGPPAEVSTVAVTRAESVRGDVCY